MSRSHVLSCFFLAACLLLSLLGCNEGGADTYLTTVEGDTLVTTVQGDTIITTVQGDTLITTAGNPAVWGSITFNVLDARTRAPLKGAGIALVDGPTVVSREDGTIVIDSIGIGSHLARVSLTGYEAGEGEIRIPDSGAQGAGVRSTVKTVFLHKKGVKLTGRVMIGSKDGKADLRAAEDVTVELRLQGNFQNVYRTATTSDKGEYTFSDLPEYSACDLSIEPLTLDGDLYRLQSTASIPANLVAATVYPVPVSILEFSQAGSLLLLSPLEIRPEQGEKLSVTFSNPVDTTKVPTNAVILLSNNVPVAITQTWEAGNTVLSIQPFQGDWPSASSLVLRLSGLRDESRRPLRGPGGETLIEIEVMPEPPEGGLGSVDSIWLKSRIFLPEAQAFVDTNVMDYSLPSYTLVWRKIREASQYEIYTRERPDDLWTLSGVADRDTTFLFLAPPNDGTHRKMTRQHMVLARNSGSRGDISKAAVFDCRDGLGPVWGFGSQITKVSSSETFDNRSNATPKTVMLRLVLRDQTGNNLEPLDIERGPAITLEDGYYTNYLGDPNYRPAMSGFSWVSGNMALIKITVEPFRDGRGDVLTLDLTGLQDLAGNPLSGAFGQTKIVFSTY